MPAGLISRARLHRYCRHGMNLQLSETQYLLFLDVEQPHDPPNNCMCVTYMPRRFSGQTTVTLGLHNQSKKPDISLQCSCHDGDGKHQEGVGHLGTTTKPWLGWRSSCRRLASTQVRSNTWGQTSSLNNDLSFSLPREHVGMYRIWVTEQMLKIRRKCFENVMSSTAFGAHNYVCTNISRGSRIL